MFNVVYKQISTKAQNTNRFCEKQTLLTITRERSLSAVNWRVFVNFNAKIRTFPETNRLFHRELLHMILNWYVPLVVLLSEIISTARPQINVSIKIDFDTLMVGDDSRDKNQNYSKLSAPIVLQSNTMD